MRVTPLHEVSPRARRVAVGTFDGVHLGHREVIRGADTVLTFDPHPSAVVAPAGAPPLLTTLERKAELVGTLGVEEMVVIRFDRDFAKQGPEAFVEEILGEALCATHVSVGENFRFGNRAKGDADLLRTDARFETRVVDMLEIDGEIVSSSRIRGLLLSGAVEAADRMLGAPFLLAGEVVGGDRRGRDLGYPTANLVPPDGFVTPGHGVYAARAGAHAAAVNIGVRPQFQGRHALIEAHLLDFDADLYGRELRLEFLARLRGERRFESVDALVEQMGRDVEDTRRIAG